jgi:hypothetical protein
MKSKAHKTQQKMLDKKQKRKKRKQRKLQKKQQKPPLIVLTDHDVIDVSGSKKKVGFDKSSFRANNTTLVQNDETVFEKKSNFNVAAWQ